MSERIGKFVLMLFLTPVLMVLMVLLAVFMVCLPFVALIYPKVININEKTK